MEKKYAVVKAELEKKFTKWHDTYDEAIKEAERLCRIEKATFYVITILAKCFIEEQPVKWELFDDDEPKDN